MLGLLAWTGRYAFSQVIQGVVLDQDTRDTIDYASVYFNGTFVGTNTDKHGNFILDVTDHAGLPLTISAIGYYSETLSDFSTDSFLVICLAPKVYELQEVIVNAKSLEGKRKRNLMLFKNEFLGITSNAHKCEILNEKDITFNYDSDKDTLRAFASKPILINNMALGYKIVYYLDRFEYYKKNTSFLYKGNIIFSEDLTSGASQRSFENRRKYAYIGSRMHFFRSLWDNDLKDNGFTVKNTADATLDYRDLVIQEKDGLKYLRKADNLVISHRSHLLKSYIVFLKDTVHFERNGYYDPSGISWEGEMAQQRIADWLPFEYAMDKVDPVMIVTRKRLPGKDQQAVIHRQKEDLQDILIP
jgi:hypothetical protein